jgi:hypothetical protein
MIPPPPGAYNTLRSKLRKDEALRDPQDTAASEYQIDDGCIRRAPAVAQQSGLHADGHQRRLRGCAYGISVVDYQFSPEPSGAGPTHAVEEGPPPWSATARGAGSSSSSARQALPQTASLHSGCGRASRRSLPDPRFCGMRGSVASPLMPKNPSTRCMEGPSGPSRPSCWRQVRAHLHPYPPVLEANPGSPAPACRAHGPAEAVR